MNLILLKPSDFILEDRVILTGRRHRHIRKVLRAREGDRVTCGRVNGKIGPGQIMRIDFDRSELMVCLDREPPPPIPLNLVLAMPRPKMLKRIIQNVTSLGVKHIFLVNSWRVEKSFWQSPVLEDEKLKGYMELGLEQAKDTVMPECHKKRFFTRFVKKELPDIVKGTVCLLAHPKAQSRCPAAINRPATLAVGPEGGWIDRETETLETQGFQPCAMGKRILTVETAATALISRLYTET